MKAKNRTVLAALLLALAVTGIRTRAQSTYTTPYTFTTLAGNAGSGSVDGIGSSARFNQPSGVAVDTNGNVYVADTYNHAIRKVTPAGVVTTLAGLPGLNNNGSADGTGSAARFYYPLGVAVDSAGIVYVADGANNTIRKVTPAGVVTTLAGLAGYASYANGTGSDARFNHPDDVAVDSAGNVYVADTGNGQIRKVTPAAVVTTAAGAFGSGLDVDGAGNIYVANYVSDTILKATPAGVVTTLAGQGTVGTNDGTGSAAQFYFPEDVALDTAGNVYVADTYNNSIRKVTPAGAVTTFAGLTDPGITGSTDGIGNAARFYNPESVAVDNAGNVYVADTGANTIRKVTPARVVTTLAGRAGSVAGNGASIDGSGSAAWFDGPHGVAVDTSGNVYVSDEYGCTIRKVTPSGGVTTLAGLAGTSGTNDGTGSDARFGYFDAGGGPEGVAVDSAGNVYVADTLNNTIRKVTPLGADWVVTTFAGQARSTGTNDGTGSAARFNYPQGVAADNAGNVYVADTGNNEIRKVTPAGAVTTLAGLAGSYGTNDGIGIAARFIQPQGVAVDIAGNVYVADVGNSTIRKVTSAGVVTTLAGKAGSPGTNDGTGSAARFGWQYGRGTDGVAVDGTGNVYVTDNYNHTIRKVTSAGVVTTLAGLAGSQDSADGTGPTARFLFPSGIAVDGAGCLYVADANYTIRKGFPASSVPAPILQRPSLNAGQFGFGITGVPGVAVEIESSGDLSRWQLVGTSVLEGGTNYFVSPIPPKGIQFYRGHLR